MPRLPWNSEAESLHNIIKALVSKYGRDATYSLEDIWSGGEGSGGRRSVAAMRDLPEDVIIDHLLELQHRGWVTIHSGTTPLAFKIAPAFQDLPDLVTPEDMMADKIDFLSNTLPTRYPAAYAYLQTAQKNLVQASTEKDFSQIGNLCVQFWEDLTDQLWSEFMSGTPKPPKDKTKDKIGPVVALLIKSKTTKDVFNALGELFEATTALVNKTKHRGNQDIAVTIRDAKLAVLLTIVLAEEIVSGI